jgi:drug/metabolite transporter (DMT)-like permease
MIKGFYMSLWLYILLGIVVNFVWGTAFLIPYYLSDTSPTAIALGRYFVYGLLSVLIISVNFKPWQSLSFAQWRHAFLLAFAGNVGYYLSLTLGIHYGGITITALIVGILPVSMIVAGNYSEKEFSFRQLALPIGFILFGIILLNFSHAENADNHNEFSNWILGGLFALVSLVLWTWYGISNARFLKQNPNISAHVWSVAIGVGCLIQSMMGLPILLFTTDAIFLGESNVNSMILNLVLGCLFLGVIVSWLATIWWNQVSRHLSVSIAGQLIVFETISSLIYGYIVDQSLPSVGEFVSGALILFGVVLGIKSTTIAKAQHQYQTSQGS